MSDNRDNVSQLFDDARLQAVVLKRLFQSKGGDGNDGGMDERLSRVEKGIEKLQGDVTDVRIKIAVVEATMATKGYIVTVLAVALSLTIAILTILARIGLLNAG